jgi:hypothetical protein
MSPATVSTMNAFDIAHLHADIGGPLPEGLIHAAIDRLGRACLELDDEPGARSVMGAAMSVFMPSGFTRSHWSRCITSWPERGTDTMRLHHRTSRKS